MAKTKNRVNFYEDAEDKKGRDVEVKNIPEGGIDFANIGGGTFEGKYVELYKDEKGVIEIEEGEDWISDVISFEEAKRYKGFRVPSDLDIGGYSEFDICNFTCITKLLNFGASGEIEAFEFYSFPISIAYISSINGKEINRFALFL